MSSPAAPVLVTGATGTVGPHVVRQLQKRGVPVRAAMRNVEAAAALRAPGVELARLDLTEPRSYEPVLAGVKKIFFCSPLADPRHGKAFIDAAKRAGTEHVVRLSVLKADREPITIAKTKHLEEDRHLLASGLTYTLLRPGNWMDNYVKHFADAIREADRFFLPDGMGTFSLIDTRDLAEVAAKALTEPGHENKIYTLTGPAAVTNRDVAATMSRVLGRTITYVSVPDSAARDAMMTLGKLSEEDIEPVLALHRLLREDHMADLTDTVQRLLGRPPRTLEQYVQDHRAALGG